MTIRYGRKIVGCARNIKEVGTAYISVEEREDNLLLKGTDMNFGTFLTVDEARELSRSISELAQRLARRIKSKQSGAPK